MTSRFILDENVVILAQKGENDDGEADSTCLELIHQIINICHSIIVDGALWHRYLTQLNRPNNSPQIGTSLLRLMAEAGHMNGKLIIQGNAAIFPEEGEFPLGSRDDIPLVRLAIETGATIVTTDGPLREHLQSSGILQEYDLRALTPIEAISIL